MATNSKSNELSFRSRSNFTENKIKNKSPAQRGMSFFIVFCATAAACRPLLGLSAHGSSIGSS